MTFFGDTARFAVEFEALSSDRSERWASVRLWVASMQVGDGTQIDSIGSIADKFRWFASCARSLEPDLEGLGTGEVFAYVFDALYEGIDGISGAEAERRYRRFVLVPNGLASFDGYRGAVFERGNKELIVVGSGESIKVTELAVGECERVMAEFVAWLAETFMEADAALQYARALTSPPITKAIK